MRAKSIGTVIRQGIAPVFALCVLLMWAISPFAGGIFQASAAPVMPRATGPHSPLSFLPGDSVIGPAALSQGNPQIAAGGGGYLVVWEDSRTNYTGFPSNALPTDGYASGQTL